MNDMYHNARSENAETIAARTSGAENLHTMNAHLKDTGWQMWVFYGSYSKPLELAGFAALIIAPIWDFRTKRRICTDKCGG